MRFSSEFRILLNDPIFLIMVTFIKNQKAQFEGFRESDMVLKEVDEEHVHIVEG